MSYWIDYPQQETADRLLSAEEMRQGVREALPIAQRRITQYGQTPDQAVSHVIFLMQALRCRVVSRSNFALFRSTLRDSL